MNRFFVLLVLLLTLPFSFGQQNVGASTTTTGDAITSGSTANAVIINSTGGWSTGSTWSTDSTRVIAGARDGNGIPFETRKRIPAAPTIASLHQAALRFTRADLAPAGYLKLAHDLGVPTDEASILEAIEHNQLEVFDYQRVDAYLYNQALKEGAKVRWVWKPARQMDEKKLISHTGASLGGDIQNVGYLYGKVYTKRVPMQVMATMKAVLDCVPDALFLISDFEVPKPDPFLAVTTPPLLEDGKIWIVQVWNEPGFGAPRPVAAPIAPAAPHLMAAIE
jgi:hypothetical protein